MHVRTMLMLAALLLLPGPAAGQQAAPVTEHGEHNQPVDADGALKWDVLANLELRVETPAPLQTVFHVDFPDVVKALDGQAVTLKGYMYPLQAGETHDNFLLSALPPSCPFCLPAAAAMLVDVHCDEPLRYTLDPVMLRGRLALLREDESGLHYRLRAARPIN